MMVCKLHDEGIRMKKIIALSAAAFLTTAVYAETDLQSQVDTLNKQLSSLQKRVSKINIQSANDNIKFDVDYRTSYDYLNYKTANGVEYTNGALLSSRLWLNMGYAPTNDLVFKGQLAYNKAFGSAATSTTTGYPQRGYGFDTFDWISSEALNDDKIRLREAYWLWMPKLGDAALTVSVGRRPSTNGYLANLREADQKPKSPLGHVINMEFDGASAGVTYDKILPGFMFKLCLGRGLTNAKSWANQADSYTMQASTASTSPNYIEEDGALDTVDMAGFIFVPYDDGQYAVKTTWYRGMNVPGLTWGGTTPAADAYALSTVGDMDGMAVSFKVDGIGNEISDFLDETTFFASYAMSTTHPDGSNNHFDGVSTVYQAATMLGSADSETGSSIWLGVNMPNMTGGRFGLEYNQGDEYWRPFTYGEDTMIGSKLATRGSAIEAYWSQPLIKKAFSMQVRYTSITYEYTGSDAFFGDGGMPLSMSQAQAYNMDPVEKAQDLRVYFRYTY